MPNTTYKEFFISYSREYSIAFAGKLHQQLKLRGIEAWFDKVNIPSGDFWEDRIRAGIINAKNFIYIVSPGSLASPHCHAEMLYALQLGKRIFPLVHCEPSSQLEIDKSLEHNLELIRNELGKRDWILAREIEGSLKELKEWKEFYENKWPQHDDIDFLEQWHCPPKVNWKALDNLDEAIEKLLKSTQRYQKYVEMHTHLLNLAYDWEKHGGQTEDLLVGKERIDAEEWLLREFRHGENAPCYPINLQARYICASKKNAQNLMAQVFVSYAMEDQAVMEEVEDALQLSAITTWVHSSDIDKNKIYGKEITKGIAEADNFLFFLSNDSLSSYWCLKELQFAISLNKRVIPLNIGKTDSYTLPQLEGVENTIKYLFNLQYVDFTDNIEGKLDETGKSDFEQDIEEITAEFNRNLDYHYQHKVLLVQAMRWKLKTNASFLLRGHNLDNALTWLRLNKDREEHPPTALHEDFIVASEQSKGLHPTEVFISYSRKDSDFARNLNRGLQETGRITWFDQESIASGVDFDQEIFKGIERCQTFLFIISPEAIASQFCERELNHAADFHKRYIPLFLREADKYQDILPAAFQHTEWIDFSNSNHFDKSLQALILALDTDREHVESHVKWQERALEWETNQKSKDFLLNATACDEAEAWLGEASDKKPLPTDLQREYINVSKDVLLLGLEEQLKTEKSLKFRLRISQVAIAIAIVLLFVSGYFIYISQTNLEIAENALNESKILEKKANDSAKFARTEKEKATKALIDLKRKEAELEVALKEALDAKKYAEAKRIEAELEKIKAKKESIRSLAFKLDDMSKVALEEDQRTQAIQFLLAAWDSLAHWGIPPNYLLERSFFKTEDEIKEHETLTVKGHNDFVSSVSFSPQMDKVLTASWDNYMKVWDLQGNLINEFPRNRSNINTAAFANNSDLIVTGDEEGVLKIWESSTAKQKYGLKHHNGSILSLAISPNDQHIVTGGYDSTIALCNKNGELLQTLKAHKDLVSSIAFSDDGVTFVSGSYDRSALVWDTKGSIVHALKGGHTDYINTVAISKTGNRVLTGGNDSIAVMWELVQGVIKANPIHTFNEHQSQVTFVAFTKEDELPITGSADGTIIKWDNYGNIIQKLEINTDNRLSADIDPLGDKILVGDQFGKASIWEMKGMAEFGLSAHWKKVNALAIAPKSGNLITVSDDNTAIIWDENGKMLQTVFGHQYPISSVAISPKGNRFVVGSWDNTASLWDMKGYKKSIYIGHSGSITSVAFSPDGNRVLTGSEDSTAILWNIRGEVLKKFEGHEDIVTSVSFSPSGRNILTGSRDKSAILWDRAGKAIRAFKGHRLGLTDVAFSPDGKKILTGSLDNSAILWGIDGTIKEEFVRHTDDVVTVGFSPNGKKIITGSKDQTAIVWGINGNIIREFDAFDESIQDVKFAPTDQRILIASGKSVTEELLAKGIYSKWKSEEMPLLSPDELDEAGIFPSYKEVLSCDNRKELCDFARFYFRKKELEKAKVLYLKLLQMEGANKYAIESDMAEEIAVSFKASGLTSNDLARLNIDHRHWKEVMLAFHSLKD